MEDLANEGFTVVLKLILTKGEIKKLLASSDRLQ